MYDTRPEAAWVMALPALGTELSELGESVNRTQLLEALRQKLETLSGAGEQ